MDKKKQDHGGNGSSQQKPINKQVTNEENDTFRILVTTDNHMGFKESDKLLGNDSFYAFNETLQIANDKNVDFVLLGGDLFHDSTPSANTYYKTCKIFNKHVFGQREVKFETFQYSKANYLNEDLKIKMPIFSIHGNHDDPTGLNMLSSLDQVQINHYVNYFGKLKNIEKIEVKPILFVKGKTKIALYGIGHIKDERLNIAFENKQIKFNRPIQDKDDWVNILVLHQNKFRGLMHGPSKRCSLMESQMPSFFDLVIWAHEHESIPQIYECAETGVHFLQPGSTVITSLCEAETKAKHCFILKIQGDRFSSVAYQLRCVRKFNFKTLSLKACNVNTRKVEEFIKESVDKMLDEVDQPPLNNNALFAYDQTKVPEELKLPYLRLKVDFNGGYSVLSQRIFNPFLNGRIANPQDAIVFFKAKNYGPTAKTQKANAVGEFMDQALDDNELTGVKHTDINYFFLKSIKQKSAMKTCSDRIFQLDPTKFISILDKQVTSNNPSLFERVVDKEIFDKVLSGLCKKMITGNNFKEDYAEAFEKGVNYELKVRQLGLELMKELQLVEVEADELAELRALEELRKQAYEEEFDAIFKEDQPQQKKALPQKKPRTQQARQEVDIEEVKKTSKSPKRPVQLPKKPVFTKQPSSDMLKLDSSSDSEGNDLQKLYQDSSSGTPRPEPKASPVHKQTQLSSFISRKSDHGLNLAKYTKPSQKRKLEEEEIEDSDEEQPVKQQTKRRVESQRDKSPAMVNIGQKRAVSRESVQEVVSQSGRTIPNFNRYTKKPK